MKTYTETKDKEPFDWNAFLNKETITDVEWKEAGNLAGGWVTCACGNQCDVIPRLLDGSPIDAKLRSLGNYFYISIEIRDKADAKENLLQIEKRSAELIKDLSK